MPKKKRARDKKSTIRVGNISDVSERVNIAGGNIITHRTASGLSTAEIRELFDQLYARIDTHQDMPLTDKEDLKAEVKEIQAIIAQAAKENKTADESFLARRFRNIARMAPDVLDVVVTTLANPLAGLGIAVKKISEKAKEAAQH